MWTEVSFLVSFSLPSNIVAFGPVLKVVKPTGKSKNKANRIQGRMENCSWQWKKKLVPKWSDFCPIPPSKKFSRLFSCKQRHQPIETMGGAICLILHSCDSIESLTQGGPSFYYPTPPLLLRFAEMAAGRVRSGYTEGWEALRPGSPAERWRGDRENKWESWRQYAWQVESPTVLCYGMQNFGKRGWSTLKKKLYQHQVGWF